MAAEFAIVKIRASQLKPLLKSGDWRFPWRSGQSTIWMPAFRPLNGLLASLGLGWLGAVFGPLAAAGVASRVTSVRLQHSLSFGVAFTIITFLHIVLGELAPKSLAIQRPKGVSLWIAAPRC